MSQTVIRLEGLGKQYPIGRRQKHRTLQDVLAEAAADARERLAGRGRRAEAPPSIWALRDVTFDVEQGETLGIIGRNGAGKSTLLKVLSRITRPTTGEARLRGRVASLLEVGAGFHPELSGRENIYLNGAVLGMKKAEIDRKFDEIVAFSEVEKFLDTPVKRYSSGMYVRLAFSVAAHLEPEILIVDEVLAVGDAAFQKKCLGKMSAVSRGGRTVLFVSHNLSAIQRLCSRAVLLENGGLAADGPAAAVAAQYLDREVSEAAPAAWISIPQTGQPSPVAITGIWYSSGCPQAGFRPCSRGPLEVRLRVDSDLDRELGSLSVTLYDRSGARLVNADTLALGQSVPLRAGENTVALQIEALYLNPGKYLLGWWAADPLGRVFAHVEAGIPVEVVDFDPAGLGVRPEDDGPVTCEFRVLEVR